MTARPISFALVLLLGAAPAALAQTGDGYLFRQPTGLLTLHGGYAVASAQSDIYSFVQQNLTLGPSDFNAFTGGVELSFAATARLDIAFGLDLAVSNSGSEFRNYVDNSNRPINQTTRNGAAFLPVGYAIGARRFVDADSALRCQAIYDMWLIPSADYRYSGGYCGAYAYGRGYGWYDNQPVVQVVAGGGSTPSGRAVNGRGYTQGTGPGTRPSLDNGGAEQSAGTGNTSQQAGASPGGYGSGSTTSTPTERTAIPRP